MNSPMKPSLRRAPGSARQPTKHSRGALARRDERQKHPPVGRRGASPVDSEASRPQVGCSASGRRCSGLGEHGGEMRAAQLTRLDGPDAVEVSEIDEPAGDGVVVEVRAAGAAFPDALLTRGLYQYKPDSPL